MIANRFFLGALLALSCGLPAARAEDVLTGSLAWQVRLIKEFKGGGMHCEAYYESNSVAARGKYSIRILLGAEGVFVIQYVGDKIVDKEVTFKLDKLVISKRPVGKQFENENMHAMTFGMNTPSFVNAFIPDLEMKTSQGLTFSVGDRQFYAPVHGFWEVSKRMGECSKKAKAGHA